MDPELTTLAAGLAQVAARNTASAVYDKLNAVKTGKANQEMVNQLSAIIDDLIEDKNELTRIARGLEQQLVAQQISNDDIHYITTAIIPAVEKIAELQGGVAETEESLQRQKTIEAVKALISPETLTILQLLGFSFRDGIGAPLTMLCSRAILAQVADSDNSNEIQLTYAMAQLAQFEIAKDNASFKRYKEISKLEQ